MYTHSVVSSLFMGLFLHQTTTCCRAGRLAGCCLWVFSYIKPQHGTTIVVAEEVVYGSFPTSNHNKVDVDVMSITLFMGLFLHQTTTCKSQHKEHARLFMGLFLHQTTTEMYHANTDLSLFMGLFLHQTTT